MSEIRHTLRKSGAYKMLTSLFQKIFPKKNVKYDDTFFQEQWFKSWEELKYVLSALIESNPRWQKILDFGCGPGVMIDFMTQKSHLYIGCDYSSEATDLYAERYGLNPDRFVNSLSDPLCQEKFDLFLSFDVFEHLKDDQISKVLGQISQIPTLFLNISRTRGIPGHVNIKSDKAWIQFFEQRGYIFASDESEKMRALYSSLRPGSPDQWNRNMFIFQKNSNG